MLLCGLIILCVMLFAPAVGRAEVSPMAPGFFPLIGWGELSAYAEAVSSAVASPTSPLVEAGLTVAGFVPVDELDACSKLGLAALVADPRSFDYDWHKVAPAKADARIKSLVEATRDNSLVMGYLLRDEPDASLFKGLGIVTRAIHKYAPDKIAFVNLLPNYATPEQWGTATYEEYVERFMNEVGPSVLCYDHYAMMQDGSIRPGYFHNLAQIRAAAQAFKRPFWNVSLSNAHFDYARPSLATLHFQDYTMLAAGGRGIAYFTFYAPPVGNYRLAPIDQFGHKTQTFDYVRKVNLEIRQLAPTLNQLTSTGLYAWPEALEAIPVLPETDALLGHVEAATPLLIGEFRHTDGSHYVLVVNLSLTEATWLGLKGVSSTAELQLVSPYTGGFVPYAGEQAWLAPGQGHLVRLD